VNLGTHAGFILGAYAVAVLVVTGLVVWVTSDHRALRRALAELDAQGVRRRSAARGDAPE
jgi:heme exporter protein D